MRLTIILPVAAALVFGATACDPAAQDPVAVQSTESGKGATGKGKPKSAVPIKLVAKRATATKSVLSSGGALTCVKVTVTNQGKKQLEVNPLYFSITDTGGTKHSTDQVMGEYENAIDTTQLAPGEKATGMVCGKGRFTPKTVAMTNALFSEAARAQVA
ncbi:DUF4352 domain-containing protein [Actinomadura litoris]|uniref:DUF4352 domain-containing protein n=1 Tax=Actinomadura litoris TaxID=2678616 RepID=A0A7K1LAF7_9ACTN|nr:DUF4352 domain-containing protein [Actinomadura litoris]MUN41421.1 DUF4352 domain-containing protein [Actinomadura litoris]